MNSSSSTLAATLALVLAASVPVSADTGDIKGPVTVSRTAPDAVLIWDATLVLADLTASNASRDAKLRQLEVDGVTIMHARSANLASRNVELRIVYAKTNVGAQYGDPTLDKKEKLVVLSADRRGALANGDAWMKDVAQGAKTPGLKIDVTGSLP